MSGFFKDFAQIRPYDETLTENFSMYDHMPYELDETVCTRESICLVSGNVIKYYSYNPSHPFELDNQDDLIIKKIANLRKQQQLQQQTQSPLLLPDELSDEQLKNLVEDTEYNEDEE